MRTDPRYDYNLREPRLPPPVDASLDDAPIDRDVRLGMYRTLEQLRQFGQRAYDLFMQNLVKGTTHLSLGMEAVATGFGAALRPDDYTFASYRGHAHSLARVPDREIVDQLGTANVLREGTDVTIAALALMVPRALEAAARLDQDGISAEVIDVRSLVPLDTRTLLDSVGKTGRFVTVEENPRLCGWGAELISIVAEEAFWQLDGPCIRITTPHIPLPAAASLEDLALPSADRIYETVAKSVEPRSGP